MKKIELDKRSKELLRLVCKSKYPHNFMSKEDEGYFDELKENGLIEICSTKDGDEIELTPKGRRYIKENPSLSNPFLTENRKFIIEAITNMIP